MGNTLTDGVQSYFNSLLLTYELDWFCACSKMADSYLPVFGIMDNIWPRWEALWFSHIEYIVYNSMALKWQRQV